MGKNLTYIASPYAGDVERNVAFAIQCCRFAIGQGRTPIAPHLIYPQVLNDDDPKERAIGLALGHQLLATCEEIWVCGSQISRGMAGEIEVAKELNLPIRYVDEAQIKKEQSCGSLSPFI